MVSHKPVSWLDIQTHNIICGSVKDNFRTENVIITIISFIIYKDWLLKSLQSKRRSKFINKEYILNELHMRGLIYKQAKLTENYAVIEQICNCLK